MQWAFEIAQKQRRVAVITRNVSAGPPLFTLAKLTKLPDEAMQELDEEQMDQLFEYMSSERRTELAIAKYIHVDLLGKPEQLSRAEAIRQHAAEVAQEVRSEEQVRRGGSCISVFV